MPLLNDTGSSDTVPRMRRRRRAGILASTTLVALAAVALPAVAASTAPFALLSSLPGAGVGKIAVDPSHPATLYLGAGGGKLAKTTDAGSSWTMLQVGSVNEAFRAVAVDPANSSVVFAFSTSDGDGGVSAGVYESKDAGATWARLASQPAGANGHAGYGRGLVFDAKGTTIVLADKRQEIFLSSNLGKSWSNPLPGSQAFTYGLFTDPNNPMRLWTVGYDPADNYKGVLWTSANFGQSWTEVAIAPLNQNDQPLPYAVAVQPATGAIVVGYDAYDPNTGAPIGGVVVSSDGGKSWSESAKGIAPPFTPGNSIVFDPTQRGTVLLTVDDGPGYPDSVYLSKNSGGNWSTIGAAPGLDGESTVFTAAAEPAGAGNPAQLLAGGGSFYSSADHGATWKRNEAGLNATGAAAILNDGLSAKGLYAAFGRDGFVDGQGLFHSADGGKTWSHIDSWGGATFVNAVAVDPVTSTHPLYATTGAASGAALYRSTDAGGKWTRFAPPLPAGTLVSALVADPVVGGRLFLVPSGNGSGSGNNVMLRSDNSGANWGKFTIGAANDSFAGAVAQPLVADPKTSGTLYAAMTSGLWKSTDAGARWTKVTGLSVANTYGGIAGLAVTAGSPEALYVAAGTESASGLVYALKKSTNGGASWTTAASPFGTQPFALAAAPGGRLFGYYNCYLGEGGNSQVALSSDGGSSWGIVDSAIAADVATGDCPAVMPAASALYLSDPGGSNLIFAAGYASLSAAPPVKQ